ncbi:MAG: coproporphyrinogen dehydrogenase HemZ [Defluviitaleaceae bacterium]|nr:coproporphyrinogen dehydrogenase HemZ [Defluviitaleaceae bacterium]
MDYKIIGHGHTAAVVDMIQVFFPNEKYKALEDNEVSLRFIESRYENGLISARFFVDSKVVGDAVLLCHAADNAYKIKHSIYEVFKGEYKPPWGILTGIRPAKIVSGMLNESLDDEQIISHMSEAFLVSADKVRLCIEVAKAEKSILERSPEPDNSYSLYIGIPFCPSRCLYCSFTSYPVIKYAHLMSGYVETLKKELDYVAGLFSDKALETIYIGGGTPTSLDDKSFTELLSYIEKRFDLSNLREYTVEAGRADTITSEKLDIMRQFNISRISINPQSINDKTLVKIGRNHTWAEFMEAYDLARAKDFNHINIDLILGLPDENEIDVENTFKVVTTLAPDEITVHTLALKRASRLKEELSENALAQKAQMEKFLSLSKYYMDNFSYKPYYMYRQKNTLGNFENIGYRKFEFGCIYNVKIMEECQNIAAVGAGAVSKFVNRETNRIERAFAVKNVDEYIGRIDEMIKRKAAAYYKAAEEVENYADN